MLPYRFRRQIPLVALGVAAIGATVLFLPSGEAVTPASALTASTDSEPATPSYIVALPKPTTDDIVTGSIAPAAAQPQAFSKGGGAIQTTGLATLAVVPSPLSSAAAEEIDAAAAEEIDAAAAEAEAGPPAGDLVHVGNSAVNVRAGPTTSSRKLFVLQPGDAVAAAEIEDGWVRIVRSDGESGWVYSRYLNGVSGADNSENVSVKSEVRTAEAMPVKGEVRRVSGKSVRLSDPVTVRDGPSKSAERLFVLERGERITIADVRGGWARVILPSGVSGWIPVR